MPNDVRGSHASIRVVVDALGRVMSDSVIVCGIANPTYSRRVAEAAAALQFQPRRAAGHPVVAPALLVYDF
jgi:hypothetical protein